MKLPDYCQYAGPALTLDPPFPFTNVMVTAFPLRADLDTLQRFIDSYLNIVPPEVASFRVPLPYVYLMLLDYGKLANQATNFGSFSQREMLFLIPLEWYKRVDGRWVFHDWASVTPFIYVDGQISLTLGRTAMGWPKSMVKVTPRLTGWLEAPDGLTTDISISAKVFAETYEGAQMQEQPVVIVRSAMQPGMRFMFDPDGPLAPWNLWGDLGRSVTRAAQDYFSMLGASGVLPPNATSSPENFMRKLQRALGSAPQAMPWAPNLSFNSVNLKQFRRADDPSVPCYQALTCGPMRYTSFMGGGQLGNQLWDSSGGYVVDLACWPTFPIVDALGLEATTYRTGNGPKIARARPSMPFWYMVNMEYGRTQTLALRGEDRLWRASDGEALAPQPETKSYYFNTTIGAANPVVTGPFHFKSASLRVLSLSGTLKNLQDYLDAFLNRPLAEGYGSGRGVDERFEVWRDPEGAPQEPEPVGPDAAPNTGQFGPSPPTPAQTARVYLALVDWGDVSSETNSLGDWADTTLTFYIPVKRWSGRKLAGVGLFPAYSYASGTIHTCTLTELYGVPTTQATFVEAKGDPRDLERRNAFTALKLLVESVPALHEGQMVQSMPLLELVDTGTHRPREITPKKGHAGLLGSGITVYTLKQFRDVSDSAKACYQALIEIPHQVRVNEVLEVPRQTQLHFHDIPMHPICEKLGLLGPPEAKAEAEAGQQIVTVESWILLEADVFIANGDQLYSRVSTRWEKSGADTEGRRSKRRAALETAEHGPDAVMKRQLARFPSQPPPAWKTL